MDARGEAAESVLREMGIPGRVTVEGHDGSIAAITAPPAAWARLVGHAGAEAAERIRGLGFRYVAIDLAADDQHTDDGM